MTDKDKKLPTVPNNELPAELLDLTERDAGKGVSFDPDDQLMPLIYVLQSNSPAVDKRGQAYIEDAEPGHFYLRNALHPIVDGVEGMSVIPLGMRRVWIEWLPNRGGFVTRHEKQPADMVTKAIRGDDGRERSVLMRPNGNVIQETREFFLLIDNAPYVLPCAGTKHTFARQWQSTFQQFRHPRTHDVMPSYSRKYRLTTVPKSNALGNWFGLKFQDEGYVNMVEYNHAHELSEAIKSGAKQAEAPVAEHSADGGDDIPF